MEEFVLNLGSPTIADLRRERLTAFERIAAYLELTKPRITFLIVLTSAAGFSLATRGRIDYLYLLSSMFGIALLSSGIATLETYLAVLVNPLSALLGLTVIAGYLFGYTPLKTKTSLSTLVGAFPGAVPPLVGWTAARGELSVEAFVLFAILFLWQFPHFLAIAWMYREDYSRAGILMLPVIEPNGHVTAQQIVVYTLMLLPVSLLPTVLGISGKVYLGGAIVLGLLFLYYSVRAAFSKSNQQARQLLLASVFYLPLLFILMVLDS